LPKYTLKRKVFKEDESIDIPTGKTVVPLAIFKLEYLEDNIPKTAIEIWFLLME